MAQSAADCRSFHLAAYSLGASHHRNPLGLKKIILLDTRRSSTRGLPWHLGKKGRSRTVKALKLASSDISTAAGSRENTLQSTGNHVEPSERPPPNLCTLRCETGAGQPSSGSRKPRRYCWTWPPANLAIIREPRMMAPEIAWIQKEGTCARVRTFWTTPSNRTPVSAPNMVPLPPSREMPPMTAAAKTVKISHEGCKCWQECQIAQPCDGQSTHRGLGPASGGCIVLTGHADIPSIDATRALSLQPASCCATTPPCRMIGKGQLL